MYNIDQEVYVKGIITGISKEDDGSFEYKVTVESPFYTHGDTVRVTEDQIKIPTRSITIEELEEM